MKRAYILVATGLFSTIALAQVSDFRFRVGEGGRSVVQSYSVVIRSVDAFKATLNRVDGDWYFSRTEISTSLVELEGTLQLLLLAARESGDLNGAADRLRSAVGGGIIDAASISFVGLDLNTVGRPEFERAVEQLYESTQASVDRLFILLRDDAGGNQLEFLQNVASLQIEVDKISVLASILIASIDN